MVSTLLVTLTSLIDDAKCYTLVRQHRWPSGVRCPQCDSAAVARNGHDNTQADRQRHRCKDCDSRFDDLTGTVLCWPDIISLCESGFGACTSWA